MSSPQLHDDQSFDFAAFFSAYQAPLNQVNTQILEYISHSNVPLVAKTATHLITAGGKRLRPLLVILCAELTGTIGDEAIAFATAVEFIHTATLLHDDVIDNGKVRRGKETAAVVWGNKTSVLSGDYLLSKAFECALKTRNFPALDLLSRTTSQIAEGEILQLSFDNGFTMTLDDCLNIMKGKTAVLFAAACYIGASTQTEPSQDVANALYTFGLNLGIAFQIMDDLLDYMGSHEHFGKMPGNDLQQKSITIPAIVAYHEDVEQRAQWESIFAKDHAYKPQDLEFARDHIRASGAEKKCTDLAERHTNIALEALQLVPESTYREQLHQLVTQLTSRKA